MSRDPDRDWTCRCESCGIESYGSAPLRCCIACGSGKVTNTAPLLLNVMRLPVIVPPWTITLAHCLAIAGGLQLMWRTEWHDWTPERGEPHPRFRATARP